MINPSSFLRRALIADAIFSGVAALGFTFGAGAFASLFNLPEAFLREVGLFLIAYAAFVGWLGTRQTMMKALVAIVICLLYTSPSPRDGLLSRMPSSA